MSNVAAQSSVALVPATGEASEIVVYSATDFVRDANTGMIMTRDAAMANAQKIGAGMAKQALKALIAAEIFGEKVDERLLKRARTLANLK